MTDQEKEIIRRRGKDLHERMHEAFLDMEKARKSGNQQWFNNAKRLNNMATAKWAAIYWLMEDLGLNEEERSENDEQEKENASTD